MTPDSACQKILEERAAGLARAGITVRLASWSEADCIAAIDELIGHIKPSMANRAFGNTLYATFKLGEETIGEDVFFERVGREHAQGPTAIARLIETYCDAFEHSHRNLFWRGDDGIGIFGYAVKSLASHGKAHLKTIRRYGLEIDRHHENFFWNITTPVVLKALGETSRDAADFLIYICLLQIYGPADMRDVWEKHLKKIAAANYTPEEFARHSLAEVDRFEDQERIHDYADDEPEGHGGYAFDYIARYVKAGDWDRSVFAEWRRITALKTV